jgi:hypothetical protein
MVWSPRAYAAPGGTGVSAFRFRAFRFGLFPFMVR